MQNTFNRLLKFRSKLPNNFLRIYKLDKMNSNHFFKVFMFFYPFGLIYFPISIKFKKVLTLESYLIQGCFLEVFNIIFEKNKYLLNSVILEISCSFCIID